METTMDLEDAREVRKSLRRKKRPFETVIQAFLFLCGAISILTTIGIIYSLGSEAMLFFTRVQWEDINKTLAVPINAMDTTFSLTTGGSSIKEGYIIQIQEENMFVVSVAEELITVERGFEDTIPVDHAAVRCVGAKAGLM